MVADTFSARTSLYQAAEAREADDPTAGTQVATAKWLGLGVPTSNSGSGGFSSTERRRCCAVIRWSGSIEPADRTRIAEGPTELLRLTVARHVRQNGESAL